MASSANRLDWVDAAKGLSIILVVMMHSAYGVGADTNNIGVLHYIIFWATPFRMPEFFLISGLFLSLVIARPWLHYADRRIVHYLYFYAVWVILQVLFKVGLGTGDVAGAAQQIAWAVVEPYGVLWFIYMLAVYSLAAKLLFTLRIPHWAAFGAAALLQILPIQTGSSIIDHFAMYFVYFYAGYAFSGVAFRVVEWAQHHAAAATLGLVAFAIIEGVLVFGGSYEMEPRGLIGGWSALPVLHLALGFAGSLAVCVTAALLVKLPWMAWLRWLGEHSIVIYLAFSIPMAATRTLLLKLSIVEDTSTASLLVMAVALLSPILLYWLIQKTGWGRFLFERPVWAHLPGAPGSRAQLRRAAAPQPAE